MSQISAEEYFEEFGIENPINQNRELDWCRNAAAVTEFADRLPMAARPMTRRLAALAVGEEWYGRFAGWIIFGRQGKVLNLCRWRDGGIAGEASYELALSRDPADRHYLICSSWAGTRISGNWFLRDTARYPAKKNSTSLYPRNTELQAVQEMDFLLKNKVQAKWVWPSN